MRVDAPVVRDLFEIPQCARCGRTVDAFRVDQDLRRNAYVLVAHCHGETETVTLTYFELVDAQGVAAGVAFAGPPALPERS